MSKRKLVFALFVCLTTGWSGISAAAPVEDESQHFQLSPAQREQAGDRVEDATESARDPVAESLGDAVEKQTDGRPSRLRNALEESGDAIGDIGRRAKHRIGR